MHFHPTCSWDLASGQCTRVLEGHQEGVYVVAVTPDSRRAMSGSCYGALIFWDLATGNQMMLVACHECAAVCCYILDSSYSRVGLGLPWPAMLARM